MGTGKVARAIMPFGLVGAIASATSNDPRASESKKTDGAWRSSDVPISDTIFYPTTLKLVVVEQ